VGIVMSGRRSLIKGYFGVALVVGAVMSSASHEGSSVNSFSALCSRERDFLSTSVSDFFNIV
jgi:hypothetical protein